MTTVAAAIETFIATINAKLIANKEAENVSDALFKNCLVTVAKGGRKYVKLVSYGSVTAFIDKTTGDIYKPASWKAPAKHVRGNVLSDKNGLEAVHIHSILVFVNYLR